MKNLTILLFTTFAFSTLFAEVPADAKDANVLKAGSKAPNPTLTTIDGESVTLDELRDNKPTILAFYRGGWCPYCTRQLSALQEVIPQLKEKGWQLIALSPDKPAELAKTVEKETLEYSLVSDSKMKAAKAFEIGFQVDQPTIKKYKTYNIDLVAASGEEHQQLPVPSIFLINAEGEITFVYSNPDYKTRLSNEALLEAIE